MSEERDDQHDAINALIDEAARSLTHGEPPASLRTRVRASISPTPSRRVPVWVPATVAVVIAVSAWVVMRETPVTPRRESAPVMSRDEPRTAPGQRAQRAEPLTVARVERADAPEPQRPQVVVLSAERVVPVADPMPPIEPIEIEPVESSAMAAIERIPASPVSVDAITIERLFE